MKENLESKVIYLIEQPLDERNFKRFGVQCWIDRGWSVEVWDFSKLTFPKAALSFKISGQELNPFQGLKVIDSFSKLLRMLKVRQAAKFFIDFTGPSYQTLISKLILRLYGVKIIYICNGEIPFVDLQEGIKNNKKKKLSGRIGSYVVRKIIKSLFYNINNYIFKSGYIVATGLNSRHPCGRKAAVIYGHDFDYDVYLELNECPSSNNQPSKSGLVFLDQNLVGHTDFLSSSDGCPVTSSEYFQSMLNAFEVIKSQLRLPVYIAEHPRVFGESSWGNAYRVIKGGTAQLVKNSDIVACHYSTSVKFAVLFNKPILFLVTNELANSKYGRVVEKFATELGKSVINVDKNLDLINWHSELYVDTVKYKVFTDKYIRHPQSSELPLWNLIINNALC